MISVEDSVGVPEILNRISDVYKCFIGQIFVYNKETDIPFFGMEWITGERCEISK